MEILVRQEEIEDKQGLRASTTTDFETGLFLKVHGLLEPEASPGSIAQRPRAWFARAGSVVRRNSIKAKGLGWEYYFPMYCLVHLVAVETVRVTTQDDERITLAGAARQSVSQIT